MRRINYILCFIILFRIFAVSAAELQISAGRYHNLAVASSGNVYWWGKDFGRLSRLHQNEPPSQPMLIPGLAHIRGVAAGWEHSLAVNEAGTVYEWGFSPYRVQLVFRSQPYLGSCEEKRLLSGGHGPDPCADQEMARASQMWSMEPMPIPGIPPVRLVAAEDGVSVVVSRDGDVYCWSGGSPPQKIPGLEKIVDVRLGQFHGVALRADGEVLTWGSNVHGELGHSAVGLSDQSSTCSGFNVGSAFHGAIGIAAGVANSFAFRADGSVWGWGNNWSGQMGIRTKPDDIEPNVITPRKITTIEDIIHLEAGVDTVAARTSSGDLYSWGSNHNNMLGLPADTRESLTPARFPLGNVVGISLTYNHAIVLMPDKILCTWGYNEYGQARPDVELDSIVRPVPVLNGGSARIPLSMAISPEIDFSKTKNPCGNDRWLN